MGTEEKAKQAAQMARAELNHPLFMAAPGAKKAIQAMADALESLAHEVEILKERASNHNAALRGVDERVGTLEGVCFGD